MPLDQIDTPPARRQLLRQAGLGAVMLGAMGAGLNAVAPTAAQAAGPSEVDVLNFALNLEYLEAEYYMIGVNGVGLAASEVIAPGATPGSVTGGYYVSFVNSALRRIFVEIASDEHQHVRFLRAALGSAAVARPAINLKTSFTTLARAAGLVGPTATFNPFADEVSFLLGAFIFEDVGVTAYHGGAPYLTTPAYLSAAAGILAVEAYHAGILRTLISQMPDAVIAAADKIAALRAALSGAADDYGPTNAGIEPNLVPVDANAIAFARTPTQVLNVVYGDTTATPGLFFPSGLNGTIR